MKYGFKDIVIDSRTGLNPRKNFVLGNGKNNYITIKDIYNGQINITDKTDKVDDEAIQIIKKRSRIKVGDILFVSIGRIGETAIVEAKDDTWDVNESVFVFTLNREIITPEYFCTLFQSDAVQKYLAGNSSGSTFKSIKMNQLERMEFDLPPLKIQESITTKLSKVNAICTKRSAELTYLDDLIKARFVEMFGECRESISAGDLMHNMRNGVSPSTSGKHQEKVLTLSAITQGQFDPNMWKDGIFDAIPAADKRICSTDFYMCRGNGNKSLVGAGVYSADDRDDLVFPDTVIAASVDTTRVCLPYLFVAWMQPGIREQIEAGARTTNGTYKINQQIISKIKVPLPPLPEQQQFATFVAQIDKSKFTEIITTKHSFVINKGGDGNCFGQFSQGYVQPLVLSLHFYLYQQ